MTTETYKAKSGATQFRPVVTENELLEERSIGLCLACGAEAHGVEPDARKYVCESCSLPKVYGLEELVMMGLCKIVGGDE